MDQTNTSACMCSGRGGGWLCGGRPHPQHRWHASYELHAGHLGGVSALVPSGEHGWSALLICRLILVDDSCDCWACMMLLDVFVWSEPMPIRESVCATSLTYYETARNMCSCWCSICKVRTCVDCSYGCQLHLQLCQLHLQLSIAFTVVNCIYSCVNCIYSCQLSIAFTVVSCIYSCVNCIYSCACGLTDMCTILECTTAASAHSPRTFWRHTAPRLEWRP